MASQDKEGPVYKKDIVLRKDANTAITLPVTRLKMPWSNEISGFAEPNQKGNKKRRLLNLNQISEQIELTLEVSDESAYDLNTDVSRIKNATDPRDEFLRMFYEMAESGQLLQIEIGEETFSAQIDQSGNTISSYPGYFSDINPDLEELDHTISLVCTFEVGIPMATDQ